MTLDLQNHNVISALVALDTDLAQFYYLCTEQGPFFKLFFDEFTTEAHRKGLQQKPAGLPGCPPHVSHYGRDYWKPQIEKQQISAIRELFAKFQVLWTKLYEDYQPKFYDPPAPSVSSPWTTLNDQFLKFTQNICAICDQLTSTPDFSAPAVSELRQNSLNSLLQSLVELSDR
jgi:hypothetical protein